MYRSLNVTSPHLCKKNWINETNCRSPMVSPCVWKNYNSIITCKLISLITSPLCGTSCISWDRGTKPNNSVHVSKGSSLNSSAKLGLIYKLAIWSPTPCIKFPNYDIFGLIIYLAQFYEHSEVNKIINSSHSHVLFIFSKMINFKVSRKRFILFSCWTTFFLLFVNLKENK
jgi:hypothetical protein